MIPPADLALLLPPGRQEPAEQAVFRLARYVRHNRRLFPREERPAVLAIIAEWITHAAPRWPEGTLEAGDVLYQVQEAFETARTPLGCDPVTEAAAAALADTAWPAAPWDYSPAHAAVFRTFHWLNVWAMKTWQPYYFASSHAVAAALGITQTIVSRATRRMIADGLLTVYAGGTTFRATRYATRLHFDPKKA